MMTMTTITWQKVPSPEDAAVHWIAFDRRPPAGHWGSQGSTGPCSTGPCSTGPWSTGPLYSNQSLLSSTEKSQCMIIDQLYFRKS